MTERLKNRWPLFIMLILLLFCFLNFCDYAVRMVLYPYDWASGETAHLYLSQRLSRGDSLYKEVSVYPLLVANHPPVFFALSAAVLKLPGLQLGGMRLISALSALFSGFIIYLAIKQDTRSRFWATAGGLLFFISPWCAGNFLPMARVDSLMLALSLAGLYFCRRAPGSSFFAGLAALLFLLATYTKLTAIIPAASGGLWLLTRDKRQAGRFGAALLIGGGVAFYLINHWSGGEFYHQVFQLNVGRYQAGKTLGLARIFFDSEAIFFAGALAGMIAIIVRRDNSIWAYFFIFSLLNIPLTGRHGAALNYYLPVLAAGAIICGREGARLDRFLASLSHPTVGRLGLLVVAILGISAANRYHYFRPTAANTFMMNSYRRQLSRIKGDVLVSRYPQLAARAGKRIFIFPDTLEITCGPDYKGVDQSVLINDISQHRFALVLNNYPNKVFSRQIEKTLEKYYRRQETIKVPTWRGWEYLTSWVPASEFQKVIRQD